MAKKIRQQFYVENLQTYLVLDQNKQDRQRGILERGRLYSQIYNIESYANCAVRRLVIDDTTSRYWTVIGWNITTERWK